MMTEDQFQEAIRKPHLRPAFARNLRTEIDEPFRSAVRDIRYLPKNFGDHIMSAQVQRAVLIPTPKGSKFRINVYPLAFDSDEHLCVDDFLSTVDHEAYHCYEHSQHPDKHCRGIGVLKDTFQIILETAFSFESPTLAFIKAESEFNPLCYQISRFGKRNVSEQYQKRVMGIKDYFNRILDSRY